MSTTSPSPNSSPSAVPPASTTRTPPPSPSPPDPSTSSPPSQPNANPPEPATNSTASPPPQSPPPAVTAAPPPAVTAASPPPTISPPPPQPPVASPPPHPGTSPPLAPRASPPPQNVSPSLPPPSNDPALSPPSSPPPPPSSSPPESSPSPPSSNPPKSSSPPPPPPPSNPPENSPPPPTSKPPKNSPPPPTSKPPENSPPPPSSEPPKSSQPPPPPPPPTSSKPPNSSPPPPVSKPPQSSPPPPATNPPKNSPPPPASMPPSNSPPPPRITPPPPSGSQPAASPSSNSLPKSSPPPPTTIRLTPPPASLVSPPSSPPPTSPSQSIIPPSDNPIANNPSPNAPENSGSAGNGSIGTGAAVAISMVVGFIVLSLIGLTVWCVMKRKRKVSGLNGGYVMPSPLGSSSKSDLSIAKAHSSAPLIGSGSGSDFVYSPREPGGSGGLGNSRPWFTYEELVVATNGFSDQNLLGEGGFGSVYKGYLPDGREVAVKQLKIGGGQGEREFKSEVEIISRIHHRHLVSLVGYCISENQRLLVYDYVPNNTLYFHLHGQGRPVMDWATRVKIAAGAARGIAYLHEDCHPRIIHRDIKSSNILLDNNFEARVSDFGLAKLALDAHTHITTRVMGTFGYMAPEYASSGKLTEKSDVYSFGVVLLELITGRKPVDASQPLGDESLVEWARPLLSHALDIEDFEGLADPRLEKNYVESEMFRMIEAAAACVRHSAAKRPRMGQVVRAFDSMAASDLTNGMRVGESELFDSAQQSAEIRLFRRMAFGSQDYSTDFFSQTSWHG